MIKIKFAKFILVFTLALVSMSACYPSDFECMDNGEIIVKVKKEVSTSHQESRSESSQSNSSDQETHYCLCSLTCHSMFINFSTLNPFTAFDLNFPKEFQYKAQNYPEISYSLEKPPTV
ncbi:hypothetical protein SHI21_19235 [Bacteriovorax sp. PP10]|uniref:Lipoprotein n=1 Tax=Bacteriovorax antarcticus TaxID=3088717 RepID=A0ABU5VZ92_9BACT|nr:hypothetical protein [Bacteriovorax sp. PP10]MEA9358378.1 hypothetical protein [Bacteriovorax sp. PP10]